MNTKIETLPPEYEKIVNEIHMAAGFKPNLKMYLTHVAQRCAALRQADQQAQPVAWRINYPSGPEFTNNKPGHLNVSVTPLFTSPPAQPARELSDAEIVATVNSVASGFRNRPMEVGEVDDEIRQFVRAMIAASQKAE